MVYQPERHGFEKGKTGSRRNETLHIPDENLGKDSRREERWNSGSRECSGVETQGAVLAGDGDMGVITTEAMVRARLNIISMFTRNVSSKNRSEVQSSGGYSLFE